MASVALDSQRRLAAPAGRVRAELSQALIALGFQLTAETSVVVEGRRGSAARAWLMRSQALPIRAALRIQPQGEATTVAIHLGDGAGSPVALGLNGPYRDAFLEIAAALDERLGRLEPGAGADFEEPRFTGSAHAMGAVDQSWSAGSRMVDSAVGFANNKLGGGPSRRAPSDWDGILQVVFHGPTGQFGLSAEETLSCLAIPVLVSKQPNTLPAKLAHQLDLFGAKVEAAVSAYGKGTAHLEVLADERPVLEFMHQQEQIRAALPVRILHICRDCGQQRLTNPNYEKLKERNRKLRMLSSMGGISFSRHGANPFMLVGNVFRNAKLDPDFLCLRCQSTSAEELVATFCPECHETRSEGVLRLCPKCKHDFRTDAGQLLLWSPDAPLALAQPVEGLTEFRPAEPWLAAPHPGEGSATAAGEAASPVTAPPADLAIAPASHQEQQTAGHYPLPPGPAALEASTPTVVPSFAGGGPEAATAGPKLGPRGGKICDSCGREFSHLWLVRVRREDGWERQMHLCGNPMSCWPDVVSEPVQV